MKWYLNLSYVVISFETAILCDPPANITNTLTSAIDLERYPYNFTWKYDCLENMRFENGYSSMTIVCGRHARWNISLNTCNSKQTND